jgi:hypothetical protein
MVTFLQDTLADIQRKHSDLSNLSFILPSKRAGGFLMDVLKKQLKNTQFAPKIFSIEEFVEGLSHLTIVDATELIFKSYQAYLLTDTISEKDDFETYTSWATTLLNDFNEIDRYLVAPKPFFSYLSSVKTLERWGVQQGATEIIKNYLSFWNGLFDFYGRLQALLLKENLGYQGMVYREAVSNVKQYIQNNTSKTHIFIGFNALNTAEQTIIQEFLASGNCEIYWDIEKQFFEDEAHSASHFIRKYLKEWSYFQKNPPQFIANHFTEDKNFQLVEVQKNIGQAKFVGELLGQLSESELQNTAIVLGDEDLLIPLLYSLPPGLQNVNITMGVSLKNFPAVHFFELLFSLHHKRSELFYYKQISALLSHPIGSRLFPNSEGIMEKLAVDNITHISSDQLIGMASEKERNLFELLFQDWENDSCKAINTALVLIAELQKSVGKSMVDRVVLYELSQIFGKVQALNATYPFLKSVKAAHDVFLELTASASLDFEGDAYNGLQIMGVLETRVLDFERIIITSVNEGIFPSGKSNASFITYDLKQQFNLPRYNEKDAIYTYHFYRLLHRAKHITLLYNNHSEGINTGEKSRFIRQLEIDKRPNHVFEKIILSPKVQIKPRPQQLLHKTEAVMVRIEQIAAKGFSPSALTSYIRNPMEFYFQKILGLNEFEEVEENIAANTLGTIVHDTLEAFYKPFEGNFLTVSALRELKKGIDGQVRQEFKKTYRGGTFDKGKNLIVFEVAKRYVSNFIDREIAEIANGNQIKIRKIETDLSLEIPISELNFPVRIRGKVDRVDEFNGQVRIIDYKTGMVAQRDVELVDWKELNEDYKFSKVFQVLTYALMMHQEIPIIGAEAGIISFKNLGSGFLKFGIKERAGSRNKSQLISEEVLENFRIALKQLIMEICDPAVPFTEKEIAQ